MTPVEKKQSLSRPGLFFRFFGTKPLVTPRTTISSHIEVKLAYPKYRKTKHPSGFATSWMDFLYIYIYRDVKKYNNISTSQNQGLCLNLPFFKSQKSIYSNYLHVRFLYPKIVLSHRLFSFPLSHHVVGLKIPRQYHPLHRGTTAQLPEFP